MLRICSLGTLAVLLTGCGASAPADWSRQVAAIIDGVPDTNPAHDAVVAVYRAHQFWGLCSGTLIAPDVVLTAAHCVDLRFRNDYQVLFGQNSRESIHRVVDHLWIHPGWDDNLLINDLALLRLASPAPDGIAPIEALPPGLGLTQADQGMPVEFVGFGQTETGGIGQRLIAMGMLDYVCAEGEICGGQGAPIREKAICFDVSAGGTCFGDSGGPNLVRRDGVEYVAGVNSFVTYPYCSDIACSTKVDEFGAWIDAFLVARTELGDACQDDLECLSGFCADGLCCDYACQEACEACNLAGLEGTCSRVEDDASEPGCGLDGGCASVGSPDRMNLGSAALGSGALSLLLLIGWWWRRRLKRCPPTGAQLPRS